MSRDIQVGAMFNVPVECLGTNYADLIKMLTIANPEAKTQAFFGSKFAQNKVPTKLYFFDLDKPNKAILLPRNIDMKYFPNAGNIDYSGIARGNEINQGYKSSFSLRPHQNSFFDSVVFPYLFNNIDNTINDIKNNEKPVDLLIDAECGSGKTVISLYLASIYKRRTIVAVTKKAIGNQFLSTVKALFPDWSIGWEDGKNTYDITVATYSLLSSKLYNKEYFEKFGHIIMDEYHRAGASTYQTILAKAPCQYRTTLTATFRRKDGLQKILGLHIGKVLSLPRTSRKAVVYPIYTEAKLDEINFRNIDKYQIKPLTPDELALDTEARLKLDRLEDFMEVGVKEVKSRREICRGTVVAINYPTASATILDELTRKQHEFYFSDVTFHKLGTISNTAIDTEITEYESRNDMAFAIVKKCIRENRKVLILSKRKEILYKLYYRFQRYGFNCGIVISEKAKDYIDFCKKTGRTIQENREHTLTSADVILGIDKLAEEGLDIPHVDTIIFLHPTRDIEQPVGRVTRELEGKPCSQAFFLIDGITPYRKMWEAKDGAKAMFEKLGHDVKEEMLIDEYLNSNDGTIHNQRPRRHQGTS